MKLKDYPPYIEVPVNIADSTSQKSQCRFYLKAKVNNSSKSKLILVIMMNPSKATELKADNTVFNVLEHSYKFLEAKEITILNLYPFYEPNSSKLKQSISNLRQEDYKELMFENLSCIEGFMKKRYDKLILAWGNPPNSFSNKEHKKLGFDILSSIDSTTQLNENLYVYSFTSYKGLTVKLNPFHPSRKGKILGIQKIESISLKKIHSTYKLSLSREYITNENIT